MLYQITINWASTRPVRLFVRLLFCQCLVVQWLLLNAQVCTQAARLGFRPDVHELSFVSDASHERTVGYHAAPFVAGMRPGALRQWGRSARSRFKRTVACSMARPPGVRAHLDLEVDPQTDGPLTAWSRAVNQPEAPSQHVAARPQ